MFTSNQCGSFLLQLCRVASVLMPSLTSRLEVSHIQHLTLQPLTTFVCCRTRFSPMKASMSDKEAAPAVQPLATMPVAPSPGIDSDAKRTLDIFVSLPSNDRSDLLAIGER